MERFKDLLGFSFIRYANEARHVINPTGQLFVPDAEKLIQIVPDDGCAAVGFQIEKLAFIEQDIAVFGVGNFIKADGINAHENFIVIACGTEGFVPLLIGS